MRLVLPLQGLGLASGTARCGSPCKCERVRLQQERDFARSGLLGCLETATPLPQPLALFRRVSPEDVQLKEVRGRQHHRTHTHTHVN